MKKALALFLALVMIFSLPAVAFASSENNAEITDHDPVVLVRGMDFTNVKLNPGTADEKQINDFSAETIAPAVLKALGQFFFMQDKDAAIDTVISCAYDMLKFNSMDENGLPVYNSGMTKYPLSAEHYKRFRSGEVNEDGLIRTFAESFGDEHAYLVNYDWRIDPFTVADEIDAAVQRAVQKTGHKKVSLVCASMGGIMAVAYLEKYGYENISRVIFMSSTFCGTQIACDVLTGKLSITADGLYSYLMDFVSGNKLGEIGLKLLKKLGAFSAVTKITDYILENRKDDIYDRVLKPIFCNMLPLWGLICADHYEEAINYIYGSRENVNPEFLKKADALQAMMKNRNSLLYAMIQDGVKVNVLSNYGFHLIPVYESSDFSGDKTLEAYNTSGFATVAKFGQTLGDDYKAANPALLSPDRCVDLSTAILPEYTYAIKEAPHVSGSYGSDYNAFVMYLLKNTGDCKAGSNPQYPRFMVSDFNNQSLRAFD